MWDKRKSLLLILFVVETNSFAFESRLQFNLHYQSLTSEIDTLNETVLYSPGLFPWLESEFGVRLSESSSDLHTFDYKAELAVPFLKFFDANVRLFHTNRLPETMSTTQILLRTDATVWPLSFLGVFGSFGWYQRFHNLSHVTILPTFASAFPDHDLAAAFGFYFLPTKNVSATVKLATFEELDIYNLNNPFIQITGKYSPEGKNWRLLAFTRYRILLGFGRLDELMFGLGLELPVETTQPPSP